MDRRPVTVVLVAATIVLAVPTAVRAVGDGHGPSLLVLAAAVVPLVAVLLLVLAVGQLVLRRRLLALCTAAVLALDVAWLVPLYVGDAVPQGQPLVVLTANLRFGLAEPEAVVRLVRTHHVDVLVVEELTDRAVEGLRDAGLEQLLPHSELAAFRAADGCGIWSRHPLEPQPRFEARFQSPGALVHVPGVDVVVRALHPFPAGVGAGTGPYRRDYALLAGQVRRLEPALPTVLAGDLNASTDNAELRRLMGSRFRDASEVAGSGLQRTWSPRLGWPAVLHLDHVLVDDRIGVRRTQVLDLPGSDHRALLAELVRV